jgi:multicomponent Na+:H+ antiporter subunit F
MSALYWGVALFLLLNVIGGLIRIVRGPTPADRMLSAQLFGTTGVAVLLLLAEGLESPPLRDVALVFVVLATVAAATFVRYPWNQVDAAPDTGKPIR